MNWRIESFGGMGPIKFDMTREQVAEILGPPEDIDEDGANLAEYRELDVPVVRYKDGLVAQIEAFYDVKDVSIGDVQLFSGNGRNAMRRLEELNGGAEISVGIVLFRNLGLTTGRLDEGVTGEHSVCAFRRGLWDGDKDFKQISFA
jgi:hypothetical protein